MDKLVIRQVTVTDDITDIYNQIFLSESKFNDNSNPEYIKTTEGQKSLEHKKNNVINKINDNDEKINMLVAIFKDKVIGVIYGNIILDDSALYNPIAYISWIAVDEEKRGKGIGKKLIDHFINWCKDYGVNRIYLDVFSDNISVNKFYNNIGFKDFTKTLELKI